MAVMPPMANPSAQPLEGCEPPVRTRFLRRRRCEKTDANTATAISETTFSPV